MSLKMRMLKVPGKTEAQKEKRLKALREMDQLYKEIVKETKGKIPDPVITLRKLRRDRDNNLSICVDTNLVLKILLGGPNRQQVREQWNQWVKREFTFIAPPLFCL
ncbi:MAG: hypothetical protein M5U34_46225 [Chloroflexi bacterium]|nr:hypothetical protein [Chloroflexota bacterium]